MGTMTGNRLLPPILAALVLLAWQPVALGQTPVEAGSAFSLESEVLGEKRTLVVRVPFGYEEGEAPATLKALRLVFAPGAE
jgi:hypothetical protein